MLENALPELIERILATNASATLKLQETEAEIQFLKRHLSVSKNTPVFEASQELLILRTELLTTIERLEKQNSLTVHMQSQVTFVHHYSYLYLMFCVHIIWSPRLTSCRRIIAHSLCN